MIGAQHLIHHELARYRHQFGFLTAAKNTRVLIALNASEGAQVQVEALLAPRLEIPAPVDECILISASPDGRSWIDVFDPRPLLGGCLWTASPPQKTRPDE